MRKEIIGELSKERLGGAEDNSGGVEETIGGTEETIR